ncbi:glycosyltransferase family 2 protein [Polynucleobacter necessarius]|uniref:glycosyltransferase family 2 protein n=1 Tax=Polynucleobacter necessarius TaxID=576610 RepID=UPI000E08CFB9|nr:glycosyltransferase family 2 protein [Polynucleobacter necessarius]HAT39078.1 glycosyltransferase family 2 protein [Polynucleobacter sp.]
MIDAPLVAIILINWNNYQDTLECIQAIQDSTYKNILIIVVDNNSQNNSVQILKENSKDIQLILSNENTGFTGGNNIGISFATKMNADLILVLNNDTLVDKSAIEELVLATKLYDDVGIFTPKILFHPDRHLVWSAGTIYDEKKLMGLNFGYKNIDSPEHNNIRDLDYAVGCALLIRSSVFKKIGVLTEDYFATWEDVDFGLRAKKAGVRILYIPSSTIWHKESSSSGGMDSPQYVYYQTRSALVFQRRWAKSLLNLIIGYSYYFAYCIKRSYKFFIRGNSRGILAMLLALNDSIFNRLGRRDYPILKKQIPINVND